MSSSKSMFVGKRGKGRAINMSGKAKKVKVNQELRDADNRKAEKQKGSKAAVGGGARGRGGAQSANSQVDEDDDDGLQDSSDDEDADGGGGDFDRFDDDLMFKGKQDSDGDDDDDDDDDKDEEKADPYARESTEEKRLRMAKAYLQKLELDEEGMTSDSDNDALGDQVGGGDAIARRLQRDVLKEQGKLTSNIAGKIAQRQVVAERDIRRYQGHKHAACCVALSQDERHAYTGGKDYAIIKWDVETGAKTIWQPAEHKKSELRRERAAAAARGADAAAASTNGSIINGTDNNNGLPDPSRRVRDPKAAWGHDGKVETVAISSDGRYLASGGMDRVINIWDTRYNEVIKSLIGHRGAISGLAFRRGTLDLYSTSEDRTVKLWNLEEMAFVDTLYGHQSEVSAIACLAQERAVTVGRDRTMRLWKIANDSQLLFRGHTASIDCVAMLNEERFVAGGEDGSLSLWTDMKKKPTFMIPDAHGGKWITAIAAMPYSNLAATGSHDGFLRLWQYHTSNGGQLKLEALQAVPLEGSINGLAVAESGRFVAAAMGVDHRLGRWHDNIKCKNGLAIVKLLDNKHNFDPKKKAMSKVAAQREQAEKDDASFDNDEFFN
jgi:ribosomal RNA-processing protein 9